MYLPKSTKRCVSQELDNEDSAVFTFGRELTDMTSGSVVVSVRAIVRVVAIILPCFVLIVFLFEMTFYLYCM